MNPGLLCCLTLCTLLAACTQQPQLQPYTPGKPMEFPVDARAVLDELGKRMLTNCVSADAAVESACITLMQGRLDACRQRRPVVFHDRKQYSRTAKIYLACIMPRPICRGIEVRNEHDMHVACGKRA